jgi:uncharacterized damage-inducible protein DinB
MSLIESLKEELAHEAATTRKHFERLPEARLDWQPHEKSFTTRGLASHLVDTIGWTESIFRSDELDFNPATYRAFTASSVDDLLKTFDRRVAEATRSMSGVVDASLAQPWRLKMMGRLHLEKPRSAVFRDFVLSHLIHHRGQLSVYLRLLNVPVPGSYGPSADEGQ